MTEGFKTALLNFIRGAYDTPDGLPEHVHDMFLSLVDEADEELSDDLLSIHREIEATDGMYYIPESTT